MDPHCQTIIKPYIADEMAMVNLAIENIVTIDAERTFWDKVVILHGLRRWHDNRRQLRHQGHRISRHYYDIYKLIQSDVGLQARKNPLLAIDCARHAQMFFNSTDLDLKSARPGSFALSPTPEMIPALRRDYRAMAVMIFGEVPDFALVLNKIVELEQQINQI